MSLIIAYLGIISVLIIALNARYLGELLGVMDDPAAEEHKKHSLSTPLVGALMVGVLVILILANQYIFHASIKMTGISVCTLLVAALGLFDDKLRLNWQIRLGIICAVCMLLVWWVPEIRLTELAWSFGITTELGRYPGAVFSMLCLMTLVIAFNMLDGFNGGVIGFSLILFVIMAIVATNPHRQAICLFIASALGIMFVYNLKGEFFLGDGGAYALGLLVGSVALLTYNHVGIVPIFADTIFVWLALPALDCLRVVISRKVSKASPFYAGRDHLHHMLIVVSGPKRTLFVYSIIVAGSAALTLFSGQYTYLVLICEVVALSTLAIAARKRRLQKIT